MSSVVIAVPEPRASALAGELALEGVVVRSIVDARDLTDTDLSALAAVIVPATRAALTADLVSLCDRAGARILPLGDGESRLLARFGLSRALSADAPGWEIAQRLADDAPGVRALHPQHPHRIIAVWGPQGSPGRSTLAIQMAVELTRSGRQTALLDADTVAPSLALLLGLSDDSPGIAAACRRAELGGLDSAELTRLAARLETAVGTVDVLGGLNRPRRWPELSHSRLTTALRACREWAEETVVDVGAAFLSDEAEFDLAGPHRHAATSAVLREADLIIAVGSADPLGVSRFVREHAELRNLIGDTPVKVVMNRVRQGPLGIDARGQLRRTLEQFAGIDDVTFLPCDQRAVDAALLHARPISDVAPRSALSAAVRRLVSALNATAAREGAATAGTRRGSFRAARSLRSTRASRAASQPAGDLESTS